MAELTAQFPFIEDGQNRDDLFFIFDRLCIAAVKVDFAADKVTVLKHSPNKDSWGQGETWSEYLKTSFGGEFFTNESIRARVCLEGLKAFAISRAPHDAVIPTKLIGGRKISVNLYNARPGGPSCVYIVVKDENQPSLMQRIVNIFVYNSCDYFVYIDGRRNSYVMYSGNPETPLPPVMSTDYEAEQIKYSRAFVVPEEQDYVIEQMHIANYIKQLEDKEEFVFTCGIIEHGEYCRKKIVCRYYNKADCMLLLYRTDITDVYFENLRYTKELEEALEKAYTDALTSVLNRQGIEYRAQKLLSQTRGRCALMFIDLDNFKKINDFYGHDMGDNVLRQVAFAFKAETRVTDLVGRLGGDEFVILFADIKDHNAVLSVGRRILERVSMITAIFNLSVKVTASIGVSFTEGEASRSFAELIKAADELAYNSKNHGKNQLTLEGGAEEGLAQLQL